MELSETQPRELSARQDTAKYEPHTPSHPHPSPGSQLLHDELVRRLSKGSEVERLDALKKLHSLELMTPQLLSVFLPSLSDQHASIRVEAVAVRSFYYSLNSSHSLPLSLPLSLPPSPPPPPSLSLSLLPLSLSLLPLSLSLSPPSLPPSLSPSPSPSFPPSLPPSLPLSRIDLW